MWLRWKFCLTLWFTWCQADTCIQSPWSRWRLQTSSEDVTIHSSGQRAAKHHGNQLCVGQHRQFKPTFGERPPAAQDGAEQCGWKPHRAVQHHQRIHSSHHTWCSVIREHIATGLRFSLTTGADWCVVFIRDCKMCVTESCRNSIPDVGVLPVTISINRATAGDCVDNKCPLVCKK